MNQFKFKPPHVRTILAFMKSRGWKAEKKEFFYKLTPPREFNFDNPNFFARLPLVDGDWDDESAFVFVRNLAQMYSMSLPDLFDLFSQTPEEIRNEVEAQPPNLEMKRALVASA